MKNLDLDDPAPILDDEDEETLAAIEEGIRDAEAGRTGTHRGSSQTPATVDYYCLLFTQRALNDLANIVGYIAEDDDEAASRFGAALLDHVDLPSVSTEWVPSPANTLLCGDWCTPRSIAP